DDNSLLGGIPKGCTCTLTGPAYSGKTRSALEMIINAVMNGVKTAYVVAEEGFYDDKESGRNDLFSRFLQIAETLSGLSEKQFRKKYDEKYVVIPNQYHKGKSWEEFIRDYRYAVEELECKFTIIDSINMLDPSKLNTVDNLNALKTYNHEKGITCIVIGQVKDTGQPQGGEALFHTSEVALHISKKSMSSKAQAEIWGSKYRDTVTVINARSKVCHTLTFPVKISFEENGMLRAAPSQPSDHDFPAKFWD
ncbi:MAG: RAD55 family ATPase, partial [Candidatus Hodarchaeales archaeon]